MPARAAYGTILKMWGGVTASAASITSVVNQSTHTVIGHDLGSAYDDLQPMEITGVAENPELNGVWVIYESIVNEFKINLITTGSWTAGGSVRSQGAFATIAENVTIHPGEYGPEWVDVSAHDGPGWEEYIPTVFRSGNVPLTCNLVPADPGHQAFIAQAEAKTVWQFQLFFPGIGGAASTSAWYLPGFVENFQVTDSPVNGPMQVEFSVKTSGLPNLLVR